MKALFNEPATAYGETGSSTLFKGKSDKKSVTTGNSTVFHNQNQLSGEALTMLRKLTEFAKLEGNWDGYGASVISNNALTNARQFIVKNHFLDLPFYFIAPGVNGEVMIEFKDNDKAAELFFNNDGTDELLLFSNDEVQLEGTLHNNFEDLIHFFNE